MNCYFSYTGFLYKSYFGVKINDFRATGELLTCTGPSAGHRERWRTWRKPIRDLGEHVNQLVGHFGTITICAVSTPTCPPPSPERVLIKPNKSLLRLSPCNAAVPTLGGGLNQPSSRPPSAFFSHTLPPTADLIAGMREGSICSLLSWWTERDALLFCCQSAFNHQK